jgi:hypothetical protein
MTIQIMGSEAQDRTQDRTDENLIQVAVQNVGDLCHFGVQLRELTRQD